MSEYSRFLRCMWHTYNVLTVLANVFGCGICKSLQKMYRKTTKFSSTKLGRKVVCIIENW